MAPTHRSPAPRIALACAALALLGGSLHAQAPRYAVASWGTEDGMPSNVALNVRQTRDGYLWLASYEGLVRFDGVSFRTFTEPDIPGLTRASFWRIAADPTGALWAASETGGLVRYADWRWTLYRTQDGLKSDKVTAVQVEGPVVWVGTRAGVNRVVAGEVHRLPPPRGMEEPFVIDVASDGAGDLWIGTVADGLLRYRDGVYTRLDESGGLPDDRVIVLHRDRDGAMWVGTYGAGVARIHRGRLTLHAQRGPAAPRRVNDILRAPDGALWLAAENGLFRMVGEEVQPVPLPDGRSVVQASGLLADAEGNLWVGSRQGGLYRFRPSRVAPLTAAEGLPHPLVSAVDGDGSGGAWIGTLGGVLHWTPGGTRRYTRENGALRDNFVRDVLRGRDGTVWIATNGGLTRIRGGEATTLTEREGLPDVRARGLFEDTSGLWIATYRGLAHLRDGRLRTYGRAEGLVDPYVLAVHRDRSGTLWAGSQSEGLFRLQGDRFVPGPAELAGQPIFRMSEGTDGSLWVGAGVGLARLQRGRVALFTTRHGIPGKAVFQALEDARGDLWVTGPWGIAQVLRAGLDTLPPGRAGPLTLKVFGRTDGMLAREASSISRAWRAPDGVLWFATPAGVARIDPAQGGGPRRAPQTHLERVVVDGQVHERAMTVTVPPGARRLEFHFTAPDFVAPEQLRFRYRLEGFDPRWLDGGPRRAAYYTNVPPGRYVFRVQARNSDGAWSSAAGGVRVHLRPYPWQAPWFSVLVAALVSAGLFVAYRARVAALQRALREEMLRDLSLHDDLTGLYNRRGLLTLGEQVVREAERERRGFGVVFADLDGLKGINDTFGHPEGDRALRDAASLLRDTFRDSDVAARLGGDEFAVLVLEGSGAAAVEHACARLLAAQASHNEASLRPYRLSLSVGFAVFDPEAPQSIESLLEVADRRMYVHKRGKLPASA